MRTVLLYAVTAWTVLSARAQDAPDFWGHPDYTVKQWTVLDGLPSNAIRNIVQTSDGYIWLATTQGLVRFDGLRFTVFNTANTPELPGNRIERVFEAPRGYLWIATDPKDLALYHEGRFVRVEGGQRISSTSINRPLVYAEGPPR